jgi:murein DD-endopeptidase MepM/ murein hydrolase activator NlpD
MSKIKTSCKKLLTPVTLMLIPHSRRGAFNLKMPFAVLALFVLFSFVGLIYTVSITVHAVDYFTMKHRYNQMALQFKSMEDSMRSLKQSEQEFKRLFSLDSKKKVLISLDEEKPGDGSIDVEELKRQVDESMASVAEIRLYLDKQRDLFRSTPHGLPVAGGRFTSGFGMRNHPLSGNSAFHSGLDIAAARGSAVKVTADGIISFSGWSKGNGNVVVVEHGHGFSTIYAHNSKNVVKTGQKVVRGDRVAEVGSTGASTGSHLHYEVWKNGRHMNPVSFINGKNT